MDLKSIHHDALVTFSVAKRADNETLTGASVDMAGYEGVCFIVAAEQGEDVAGWAIKAQQSSDNSVADDFSDLHDTSVAFSSETTAGVVAEVDIYQPTKRYVRPIVTVPNMATTTAVAVIALRYGAKVTPVTQSNGEFHAYPAEGTA